jgi:hypothetical protein
VLHNVDIALRIIPRSANFDMNEHLFGFWKDFDGTVDDHIGGDSGITFFVLTVSPITVSAALTSFGGVESAIVDGAKTGGYPALSFCEINLALKNTRSSEFWSSNWHSQMDS